MKKRFFHTIAPDRFRIPAEHKYPPKLILLGSTGFEDPIMSSLYSYEVTSHNTKSHKDMLLTTKIRFGVEMGTIKSQIDKRFMGEFPKDEGPHGYRFFSFCCIDPAHGFCYSFGGAYVTFNEFTGTKDLIWAWLHPNLRRRGLFEKFFFALSSKIRPDLQLDFCPPFSPAFTQFMVKHRDKVPPPLNLSEPSAEL